jgi:hypothetical protein
MLLLMDGGGIQGGEISGQTKLFCKFEPKTDGDFWLFRWGYGDSGSS